MSAEKIDPTGNTPVRLSGALCAAMPIGTALLGNEGYWKGAWYVKTTPNTWCMFHKRPTPEQVWEAVEERRNNLSPHPSGSAYVYEPPAKPGAPIDPSKVKAGDTVTLERDGGRVVGAVARATFAYHHRAFVIVGGLEVQFEGPEAWTITDHQPASEPEPEEDALANLIASLIPWKQEDFGGHKVAAKVAEAIRTRFAVTEHKAVSTGSPEWKPGTVGTATVRGVEDVRVMRAGTQHGEWFSATYTEGFYLHSGGMVTAFVPDDAEALRAELEETRNEAEADAANIRGLSARVQRITRERDEARAEVERLREQYDRDIAKGNTQVDAQRREIEHLTVEVREAHRTLGDVARLRDAAHAEAERLRDLFKKAKQDARTVVGGGTGIRFDGVQIIEAETFVRLMQERSEARAEAQAAREVSVAERKRAEDREADLLMLRARLAVAQKEALPDDLTKCACTHHAQYAGSGHTENLVEYEPACPIHSEHIYDPKVGMWTTALRKPTRDEIASAIWPLLSEERREPLLDDSLVSRLVAVFDQINKET